MPPGTDVPAALYAAYRATANYVRPDGRVVLFNVGLVAGDPGTTAAMNAVPAVRAETAAVARSARATALKFFSINPGNSSQNRLFCRYRSIRWSKTTT